MISLHRQHYIDNLRATTMLLVVCLHIFLSFSTSELTPWPARDIDNQPIFNILILCLHTFTMPMFFFVAGLVSHYIYKNLGAGGFVKQRLKRIGIPFLVGMLILVYVHSIEALLYIAAHCQTIDIEVCLQNLIANHHYLSLSSSNNMGWLFAHYYNSTDNLWFLYYLILIYAATLLLMLLIKPLRSFSVWRNCSSLSTVLFFFFLTLLVRCSTDAWHIVTPISFIPDLAFCAFYGGFFAFGWLAAIQQNWFSVWAKNRWYLLVIASVTLILYALIQAFWQMKSLANLTLMLSACCGWLMIMTLNGIYFHYLSVYQKVLRYLADASYWVYLIEIPVIINVQQHYADSPDPIIIKLIFIFLMTMAITLASYQILVRHTFVGRVLNGRNTLSL